MVGIPSLVWDQPSCLANHELLPTTIPRSLKRARQWTQPCFFSYEDCVGKAWLPVYDLDVSFI